MNCREDEGQIENPPRTDLNLCPPMHLRLPAWQRSEDQSFCGQLRARCRKRRFLSEPGGGKGWIISGDRLGTTAGQARWRPLRSTQSWQATAIESEPEPLPPPSASQRRPEASGEGEGQETLGREPNWGTLSGRPAEGSDAARDPVFLSSARRSREGIPMTETTLRPPQSLGPRREAAQSGPPREFPTRELASSRERREGQRRA